MLKQLKVHLSSAALGMAILVTSGFLALIFYVPRLSVAWNETRAPLTDGQTALLDFSHFMQMRGWILLIEVLLLLAACILWRVMAQKQLRSRPH